MRSTLLATTLPQIVPLDTALFCNKVAPRIVSQGGDVALSLTVFGACELTLDLVTREVFEGSCNSADVVLELGKADFDAILSGKAGPDLLGRIELVVRGGSSALLRLAAAARGNHAAFQRESREIGAVRASRASRHFRSLSYSRANANPPNAEKQASPAAQAASDDSGRAMFASAPQGLPASNNAVACRVIRSAASSCA